MMPHTIRMPALRTLPETSSTNPMDRPAPRKAAAIMPPELTANPVCRVQIMYRATVSLAPEEMPSTKGPASGLAKKVCSRKPETARAPPSRKAARSLGRRISNRIL